MRLPHTVRAVLGNTHHTQPHHKVDITFAFDNAHIFHAKLTLLPRVRKPWMFTDSTDAVRPSFTASRAGLLLMCGAIELGTRH